MRSEEHTSELQSRLHLVCRLLLEKKNAKTCALRIWGVRSHMPPVAPCGNRSRRDTFQASLSPVFWTSMPKLPHCPRFIVAGPGFVITSAGSEAADTMVTRVGSAVPLTFGSSLKAK